MGAEDAVVEVIVVAVRSLRLEFIMVTE